MRSTRIRLLVAASMLPVLLAGTGAAAPPQEAQSFTYIIWAEVINSSNDGEWGCNEVYSNNGPNESSLLLPVSQSGAHELARDIWKGHKSVCASDAGGFPSISVAVSSQETGSVIVNQRFWESDTGNGDDYLGYIYEEVPVDGRTHIMRSVGGDRSGQDYVDFAVSVDIVYSD